MKISRPLSLLTKPEYKQVINELSEYIFCKTKPKMSNYSELDLSKDSIKSDHELLLRFIAASLCRLDEAARMQGWDLIVGGNRVWLNNREGKTHASTRPIDLGLVCPDFISVKEIVDLVQKRNQDREADSVLLFRHLAEKYSKKVKQDAFARCVRNKRELSSINCNSISKLFTYWCKKTHKTGSFGAHDFRHNSLFYRIYQSIEDLLITGNFYTFLCYLSAAMGHSSLLVTLYSYIGTAVAVFHKAFVKFHHLYAKSINKPGRRFVIRSMQLKRGLNFPKYRKAEAELARQNFHSYYPA